MTVAQILIVEDDPAVSSAISRWLKKNSHVVVHAPNAVAAAEHLDSSEFDLLILDVELPDKNGFEILADYRKAGCTALALFLTGRSSIEDKVTGFQHGADDYLTKPFEAAELMLRVDALLQRSRLSNNARFSKMGFELIPEKTSVKHKGNEIVLTGLEYRLLEFLLRRTNQILSTDKILNSVWRDEENASPEALAAGISRLRKKLGSTGEQSIIKNVHGRGYQITTDAQ